MGALTANNDACDMRGGSKVDRAVAATVAAWGGGFQQIDTNGKANPVSSTTGTFAGISQIGNAVSATDTVRDQFLTKAGLIRATITGVTIANFNAPVWAPTDNPADLSLTYTAGAKLVGFVDDMDYDAGGNVLANVCFVRFDAVTYGTAMRDDEKSGNLTSIVGIVRSIVYRVPTGKNAQLIAAHVLATVAPSYVTSCTINVNKISGGVRSAIGTVVVSALAALAEATVAITSTVQVLAAGDYLEIEVVGVGTQTTAGVFGVSNNIVEYAKI